MKNKILIIGPIGDFGGRELETGFIASVLSDRYDVQVVSTGNCSKKSQVNTFKGFLLTSLNDIIYNKSLIIRIFIKFLSYFKKSFSNSSADLSSPFLKKILNIEIKKAHILKQQIAKTDLVFICAQLSSNYLESIILKAKEYKKPIVFRTTGNISRNLKLDYLKFVNIFIHHSFINEKKLSVRYNYEIIDQCAFNEISFLKIPILNKKINNFMTVSRIEKNKNIEVVINAFVKNTDVNDRLYVVGIGKDLSRLVNNTKDKRVIFTGFIPNNELQKIYNICECFIVSYYELEAGPLTGIEAMAAGKVIISSRTGAMTERISDEYAFWHNNDVDNLYQKIKETKALSIDKVKVISEANRNSYSLDYSKNIIEQKYKKIVSNFIK